MEGRQMRVRPAEFAVSPTFFHNLPVNPRAAISFAKVSFQNSSRPSTNRKRSGL